MEDRGWRGSCRFLRYFFIDAPGEYYLAKGLDTFHSTNVYGILHCGDEAAVAVEEPMDGLDVQKRTHAGRNGGLFYIFKEKNGPGQLLKCYLPKNDEVLPVLKQFLTPSQDSSTAVAAKAGSWSSCIRAREKVLQKEMWEFQGLHQSGTHFPLCVFTANDRHRSPEAWERRARRGKGTKGKSGKGTEKGKGNKSGHERGNASGGQDRSGGGASRGQDRSDGASGGRHTPPCPAASWHGPQDHDGEWWVTAMDWWVAQSGDWHGPQAHSGGWWDHSGGWERQNDGWQNSGGWMDGTAVADQWPPAPPWFTDYRPFVYLGRQ